MTTELPDSEVIQSDTVEKVFIGIGEPLKINTDIFPGWQDHLASIDPVNGLAEVYVGDVRHILEHPEFSEYVKDEAKCKWLVEKAFKTSISIFGRSSYYSINEREADRRFLHYKKVLGDDFESQIDRMIDVDKKDVTFVTFMGFYERIIQASGGATPWLDIFPKLEKISKATNTIFPFENTLISPYSKEQHEAWQSFFSSNENAIRYWNVINDALDKGVKVQEFIQYANYPDPELAVSVLEKSLLLVHKGIPHGFVEMYHEDIRKADVEWDKEGILLFTDPEMQRKLVRFDCILSTFGKDYPSSLSSFAYVKSSFYEDSESFGQLRKNPNRVNESEQSENPNLFGFGKISADLSAISTKGNNGFKPIATPYALTGGTDETSFRFAKQFSMCVKDQVLVDEFTDDMTNFLELMVIHHKFKDLQEFRSQNILPNQVIRRVGETIFQQTSLDYSTSGFAKSVDRWRGKDESGSQHLIKIQQSFDIAKSTCHPYAEIYARHLLQWHKKNDLSDQQFLELVKSGLISKGFFTQPPNIREAVYWNARYRYDEDGKDKPIMLQLFKRMSLPEYDNLRIVEMKNSLYSATAEGRNRLLEDIRSLSHVNLQAFNNTEVTLASELQRDFSVEHFIQVQQVIQALGKASALTDMKHFLPKSVYTLVQAYGIETSKELFEFSISPDHKKFYSFIKRSPEQQVYMTKEMESQWGKLGFSLIEGEELLREGIHPHSINLEKAFAILIEKDTTWVNDEANIYTSLLEAAKIFGYEQIWKFATRSDVGRHDALYNMKNILTLEKKAEEYGVTAPQFWNNILFQVWNQQLGAIQDTSYNRLNQAVSDLSDVNFEETLAKAKKMDSIPELGKLLERIGKPEHIFASWGNLRRYADVVRYVKNEEAMKKLEELKRDPKKVKQAAFMETLLFHKDSKVDIDAIMNLLFHPEKWLDAPDGHAPKKIHDALKPSTFIRVENLALSAAEVRDGFIEGSFDKIQKFPPFEMSFTIRVGFSHLPLHEQLRIALGKKDQPGIAKNSTVLWGALKKTFERLDKSGSLPHGYTINDFLSSSQADGKKLISDEAEHAIAKVLRDPSFGLPTFGQIDGKELKLIASMHRKSDPISVLTGDDTVNCMKFGTGKSTFYFLDTEIGIFTIRLANEDENTYKTIASSVLTEDIDIGMNVKELFNKLKADDELVRLSQILAPDFLSKIPSVISCDNIEVDRRYKSEEFQKLIVLIYERFFFSYFAEFGELNKWRTDIIPAGKGFSDISILPIGPNTFIPAVIPTYTDKTHDEVYQLKPGIRDVTGFTIFTENVLPQETQYQAIDMIQFATPHISTLVPSDSLRAARLEEEIYADNPEFSFGPAIMQRNLLAVQLANAVHNTPSLCIKHTNDAGEITAYMTAWEGKMTINDKQEPILYVFDIASKGPFEAVRLVNGLTEVYKSQYVDTGNLLPLYAEFRESTSYQLITKHLNKLTKNLGITFVIEEVGSSQLGKETRKHVIIRPVLQEIAK